MQISFGKRPDGGLGGLPQFDISDWNLVSQSGQHLLYIPSAATFFRRLGVTLLCAAFAGIAWLIFSPLGVVEQSAELRELRQETKAALADLERQFEEAGLSEEAAAAVRARRAAEVNVVGDDLGVLRNVSNQLLYGSWVALAFVGLLAPLSCFWNRVSIKTTPRNELSVTTWFILPTTQTFPFHLFNGIQFGCDEKVVYSRHGAPMESYWRWFVRLQPSAHTAGVTFYPMRQQEQPLVNQPRPPKRVLALVQWLHNNTRLPITGPLISEPTEFPGIFSGRDRRKSPRVRPVVEHINVGAHPMVAGLAPHLKAEVLGMSGEIGRHASVTQEIHYTDSDGNEHVTTSFDELPPEILSRVMDAMQHTTPEVHTHESHSFTVQGMDGTTRTYNSLDELPPELRAIYEKHRPG